MCVHHNNYDYQTQLVKRELFYWFKLLKSYIHSFIFSYCLKKIFVIANLHLNYWKRLFRWLSMAILFSCMNSWFCIRLILIEIKRKRKKCTLSISIFWMNSFLSLHVRNLAIRFIDITTFYRFKFQIKCTPLGVSSKLFNCAVILFLN